MRSTVSFLALLVALLAQPSSAQSGGSLTTTFAGGVAYYGNMFDFTAFQDLTIETLDGNWSSGTATVEVYHKLGTYRGYEFDPQAWTFDGAVTFSTNGFGVPTPLPLNLDIPLATGTVMAFYVRTIPGAVLQHYSVGSGIVYTNGDAQIEEGAGLGQTAFGNPVVQNRTWNGTVHYRHGLGGPRFAIANLVAGQTAILSVDSCTPGNLVIMAWSVSGPGPTMSPYGPVDMTPPIHQLPVLSADAQGQALLFQPVPVSSAGKTLYSQAVELLPSGGGRLSNSLALAIQ